MSTLGGNLTPGRRLRNRCAVLARVRGSVIHANGIIAPDGLASTHRVRIAHADLDLVASLFERLARLGTYPIFHQDVATRESSFSEPRGLERRLNIQSKVHDVGNKL